MRVALVKGKTSFQIIVPVILVLCLYLKNVEAQANDMSNYRISRKTCRLKPEPGPCRANIMMYFFDPKQGSCRKFVWGGCQGNGNRFDTRDECQTNCVSNITSLYKTRPRYCNLTFDYGFCFGALPRYYYDPMWKVCKERIYSGCGGNKNNFYSMEQCDMICRFGNGFMKSIKLKQGHKKRVLIVNPPDATSKKPHSHRDHSKKAAGSATGTTDKT